MPGNEPYIEINPDVALKLLAYARATEYREFSGFGFCKREGNVIRVYDFELLNVGSGAYTEIPSDKVAEIAQRRSDDGNDMHVWIHKHPVGNGTPGPHNWSGTDNDNIKNTPMGGIPALVGWSVSIVLTPGGWVGRIDSYQNDAQKTKHLKVLPDLSAFYQEVEALRPKVSWFVPGPSAAVNVPNNGGTTIQRPLILGQPHVQSTLFDYPSESGDSEIIVHQDGFQYILDPDYVDDDPGLLLMMLHEYGPSARILEILEEQGFDAKELADQGFFNEEDLYEPRKTLRNIQDFFGLGRPRGRGRGRGNKRRDII